MADALGQLAVACFGGTFGHGGQQRAHHLRVAAQAGQANGSSELARRQVHNEQAACRGRLDGADPVLRMLAQAMALEQANHRQGQQDDERQVARLDEACADGSQDLVDGKPRRQGRAHGRDDHDQHGVKPQDKAHDDDGHPDEWPQIDVTKHVDPSLSTKTHKHPAQPRPPNQGTGTAARAFPLPLRADPKVLGTQPAASRHATCMPYQRTKHAPLIGNQIIFVEQKIFSCFTICRFCPTKRRPSPP